MNLNPSLKRIVLTGLLTSVVVLVMGCSHRSQTVIGGPDAEEAAIRMEESEQEYNDCIASRHAGGSSCDSLKALYEKDKAEYEAQVQ